MASAGARKTTDAAGSAGARKGRRQSKSEMDEPTITVRWTFTQYGRHVDADKWGADRSDIAPLAEALLKFEACVSSLGITPSELALSYGLLDLAPAWSVVKQALVRQATRAESSDGTAVRPAAPESLTPELAAVIREFSVRLSARAGTILAGVLYGALIGRLITEPNSNSAQQSGTPTAAPNIARRKAGLALLAEAFQFTGKPWDAIDSHLESLHKSVRGWNEAPAERPSISVFMDSARVSLDGVMTELLDSTAASSEQPRHLGTPSPAVGRIERLCRELPPFVSILDNWEPSERGRFVQAARQQAEEAWGERASEYYAGLRRNFVPKFADLVLLATGYPVQDLPKLDFDSMSAAEWSRLLLGVFERLPEPRDPETGSETKRAADPGSSQAPSTETHARPSHPAVPAAPAASRRTLTGVPSARRSDHAAFRATLEARIALLASSELKVRVPLNRHVPIFANLALPPPVGSDPDGMDDLLVLVATRAGGAGVDRWPVSRGTGVVVIEPQVEDAAVGEISPEKFLEAVGAPMRDGKLRILLCIDIDSPLRSQLGRRLANSPLFQIIRQALGRARTPPPQLREVLFGRGPSAAERAKGTGLPFVADPSTFDELTARALEIFRDDADWSTQLRPPAR